MRKRVGAGSSWGVRLGTERGSDLLEGAVTNRMYNSLELHRVLGQGVLVA